MKIIHQSIIVFVYTVIFLPVILVYFFFLTERGSKIVVDKALKEFPMSEEHSIGSMEGTVLRRMVFKDVEFKDLEGLPPGNILRIQELELIPHSLNKEDTDVRIENGRLMLPHSEPILFYGTYLQKNAQFTLYSKSISLNDILQVLEALNIPSMNWVKFLSGTVAELDLSIKGRPEDIHIQGDLTAERCSYKDFRLSSAPLSLNLNIKDARKNPQLFGKVTMSNGTFQVRKTAIEFASSEAVFSGNPAVPAFHLDGRSTIGSVDIKLKLKGTLEKPEISLNSAPPLPQDLLLVMLATGKEWKGVKTSVDQKALSTDLFADFIDYFLFAGRGEKMAQKFGLKDIEIELEKNRRGIGISKDITSHLEVSYGVDQVQESPTDKTISQKLGGKVKVTETISVGVEREIKEKTTLEESTLSEPNDKVMMEYKKKF